MKCIICKMEKKEGLKLPKFHCITCLNKQQTNIKIKQANRTPIQEMLDRGEL